MGAIIPHPDIRQTSKEKVCWIAATEKAIGPAVPASILPEILKVATGFRDDEALTLAVVNAGPLSSEMLVPVKF
jgi:hypothetical protein